MELQGSDENKDSFGDDIIGSFNLLRHIKDRIFGILFVLLKDNEISIYVSGFLCIVETLQVISLIFHEKFASIWGSEDIFKVVSQALGYTRLLTYIEDTTASLYSTILYVLLAVIFIMVLASAYVSYIYESNKMPFTWIIQLLRILVILVNSFLFVPAFEYFFSFFNCTQNSQGQSVHTIFPDVLCGSGQQLANCIIAAVAIVLLLFISAVTTLTLFEARNIATKPNSRVTARSSLLFNMYKLLIIILLTFISDSNFFVIIVIGIMGGSALVFSLIQFDNPFYNHIIAKVWSTSVAVNLWSATMLVFALIMQGSFFKESLLTWIIGLPLVLFVVIQTNDKRMDYLLINVNRFEKGKEIINQVTYLLKLLDTQYTDPHSAILLDGYLEVHKQDCPDEDCPLKRKNKILTNNKIIRNLLSNDSTISEKEAIIVYLIYQLYMRGFMQFPTDTTLRCSYAFFLLDKMHSRQQALQELTDAEAKKPPFDEQFIIFRYKKILEDEIAEAQNEQQGGGLDLMNELAFQTHLRMCQANIEKASLLHLEFWSQLSEDQPDLAKLGDIGSKITMAVKGVESYWGKLMKINPTNTKMIRLFGKFLIEILHDKERGEELLERARNLTSVKNSKKNMNFIPTDNSSDEGTPLIVISGEKDKFALITSINLAAASIFGFNKNEILNRKLNTLMPPIYAKYHDSFIDNYLAKNESEIIGKNKERLAFGKNKANYIFPFYYNLKAIPSIILGIQFISTIRVEKNLKNTAYVLTSPDGAIDSISASCISLLKFDIKHILHKKLKIQDCIPNILQDRATLFATTSNNAKTHARVMFNYPKGSEYVEEDDPKTVPLNCHLNDLSSTFTKDNFGLLFNFDKASEKTMTLATTQEARITNFQFRYAKNKASIMGEFAEDGLEGGGDYERDMSGVQRLDEEETDLRGDLEGEDISFRKKTKTAQSEGQQQEYKKVDYGIGIRTLRLVNGGVGEIEEDKSEEGEDEDDAGKESSKEKKGFRSINNEDEDQDEGSLADFGNSEKSKKVLASVINDRSAPPNIRNLKVIGGVLCLVLIGLSIFDYINIKKKADDISGNIANLDVAHRLIANMMMSLSNVRDLYLLDQNIITADETELRTSLRSALDAAKVLKEYLEADTTELSESHSNLLNNPVISLSTFDGDFVLKGLIQATEDVITKGFNMVNAASNTINPDNPDYYFLTVNMLNNYYLALVESSQFYAQELVQKTNSDSTTFVLILVFSIIAILIALAVIMPIIYSITKSRDHILSLFFDIPSKTVKLLYSQCENFIANLQVGEEDEMTSQIDEEEANREAEDNDSAEWMTRRRRRKKFKNTGKNYRSFFLTYAIMACVLEVIFIYNFTTSNGLLSDVASVATEFNATSFAEFFYSFANNAERQLIINSSIDILNRDPVDVTNENIVLMQNLDSQILSENSVNIGSHTDEYNDVFKTIMYSDSCPLLTAEVTYSICEAFADKTVTKGMTVATVRHFENMRTLAKDYIDLQNDEPWPYDTSYLIDPTDTNKAERILSLFRIPEAIEIADMQKIYLKNNYRKLLEAFKVSLGDEFDSLTTLRLLMFILFLLLAIVIYLFLWLPLVSALNTRLWKTKSMLRMIPIGVMVKIRNIRNYLRNFLNENHLHDY